MHGVPLKAKPRSLNGNLLALIKLNDRYVSSRSPKKGKKLVSEGLLMFLQSSRTPNTGFITDMGTRKRNTGAR